MILTIRINFIQSNIKVQERHSFVTFFAKMNKNKVTKRTIKSMYEITVSFIPNLFV